MLNPSLHEHVSQGVGITHTAESMVSPSMLNVLLYMNMSPRVLVLTHTVIHGESLYVEYPTLQEHVS